MKIYSILFIVIFSMISIGNVSSQTVAFQFAPKDSMITGSCTSMTQCVSDEVCYFIEYTPSVTGTLTSYTMGFIATCTGNDDPVLYNSACTITDNSNIIDECEAFDLFLLQIAGTGTLEVEANVPVVLHQVCFDLRDGETITVSEDPVSALTVNIDLPNNGGSTTDVLGYSTLDLTNEVCECFSLTPTSGSPSQTIDCLSGIDPIEYAVSSCNSASVLGLAPGLSYVLINGVINIEGAPNHAGTFPFVLSPAPGCDCKPKASSMTIDSSRVMIENACFNDVESAISVYQNGEIIEIYDDVITPAGLSPLGNIIIRINEGVEWRVKGQ